MIRGTSFDHALSGVPSIVDFMTPDAWSALANWALVVIALVAAGAAFWQVREARSLRLEQAQPYVVAYMESNRRNPRFIELVFRNFGTTAAVDVTAVSEPALRRSTQGGGDQDLPVFDVLPVLVPGQEWRTVWDFSTQRDESPGLTDRYDVSVAYKDSRGKQLSTNSLLDWGPYKRRAWLSTYDTHEVALALRPEGNIGRSLRGIDRDLTRIAESLSLGDGCCTPGARGAGGDGDGDGG